MGPVAAFAISSGLQQILPAAVSFAEGAINRSFTAKENQKNRDWQQWMSSTAHQREVADLKNAGLNPYLSAGGSGATSAPSGASGGVSTISQAGTILANVLPTMVQSAKTLNDMKTSKSKETSSQILSLVAKMIK